MTAGRFVVTNLRVYVCEGLIDYYYDDAMKTQPINIYYLLCMRMRVQLLLPVYVHICSKPNNDQLL